MKRLLLFIFAIFYLGISSGVTLNYHYCKGKLAEVSLLYEESCSNCGKTDVPHPCCATETEFVKLSVDQDVADAFMQLPTPSVVALLFSFLDLYIFTEQGKTVHFNPIIDPPKVNNTPLFIRHCTYLI